MRKLEVYDNTNKNRLLGHLEVTQEIKGYRYEVAVMPSRRAAMHYRPMDFDYDMYGMKVTFNLEPRSRSNSRDTGPFSRQIVTDEWKVLETSAKLETLLQIDRFTLPGEDRFQVEKHQRLSDY